MSTLQGSPKQLQSTSAELGHFIEKKDPAVSQRHLTRLESGIAQETRVRNGVVRCTKWTDPNQSISGFQEAGRRVKSRDLNGFGSLELW